MDIRLVGSEQSCKDLHINTLKALDMLGLSDSVSLEIVEDSAYATDLGITQDPALCIEESSIDFKDMIFE